MNTTVHFDTYTDDIATSLAQAVAEESKLKSMLELDAAHFYLGRSPVGVAIRCILLAAFVFLVGFVPSVGENVFWITGGVFLYIELVRSNERISALERLIVTRDNRVSLEALLENKIAEQAAAH